MSKQIIMKSVRTGDGLISTQDGFVNFAARLGYGTGNQADYSSYNFANRVTLRRQELEAAYRQSWIVGVAVDAIAEDMTQGGITITSTLEPEDIEEIQSAILDLNILGNLADLIRWSRLFGGAIAVLLIDGQDLSTPLKLDSIGEDQFKGLYILDRWQVMPTLNERVEEYGPDFDMPAYYTVTADRSPLRTKKIHHTRVVRMEGIRLPVFQRRAELEWGESILERIWDRITAFDSSTLGAAQLAYKAHLRTYSIDGLREILAAGGDAQAALLKQIDFLRATQSNEGLTLMDATDKFEAHTYTFSGLADIILQLGQQLSGSLQVPLVRLFGQSPAGLNATGESDLRNYYDGINREQDIKLRPGFTKILDCLCRSKLNKPAPKGFKFKFNSLWKMSDNERADIGQKNTTTVLDAYESGLVRAGTALKELRQQSEVSGMWTNITQEEIDDAENAPPPFSDDGLSEEGSTATSSEKESNADGTVQETKGDGGDVRTKFKPGG